MTSPGSAWELAWLRGVPTGSGTATAAAEGMLGGSLSRSSSSITSMTPTVGDDGGSLESAPDDLPGATAVLARLAPGRSEGEMVSTTALELSMSSAAIERGPVDASGSTHGPSPTGCTPPLDTTARPWGRTMGSGTLDDAEGAWLGARGGASRSWIGAGSAISTCWIGSPGLVGSPWLVGCRDPACLPELCASAMWGGASVTRRPGASRGGGPPSDPASTPASTARSEEAARGPVDASTRRVRRGWSAAWNAPSSAAWDRLPDPRANTRLRAAMAGQTSKLADLPLLERDPEIAELIRAEERREADKFRLIPSENYVSRAVLEATGSVLTNKYSEGYADKRYYEGQQIIDRVERLAIDRMKSLFGAEHVNVQPYSGSPANLSVYLAFCAPHDPVMGLALPAGGHLTHGWNVSITGKYFNSVGYGVRREDQR